MDFANLIQDAGLLWSARVFGLLAGLSVALVWLAFVPSQALQSIGRRLDRHVESGDRVEEMELRRSFIQRVVLPTARRVLGWFGRRMPLAVVENTERQLIQAGEPWGLSGLDFLGICLLLPALLGGGYLFLVRNQLPLTLAARNALLMALAGFAVPRLWLWSRVRRRQKEIERALPDALDMLSIGVEAGLAFESALLRVAEQWDNALTEEFRRTVGAMRLGTARDQALEHMAERTGVQPLASFVAVLVQSTRLGVSISQVLHAQAAQMRLKRRQLAEERARQASLKMIFPLVFLVFPAMFVVLLGPAAPDLVEFISNLAAGGAGLR